MKAFLRKNYCWVIALVALLGYALRAGITNNLNSLYLIPVSDSLGVSRTAFSLTVSIRSVGTFLSNMAFGLVYRKLGFRKLAALGLAVMGLSIFGLASAQTIIAYAVFFLLLGLFEAAYSTAALSKLVGEWFIKYRGTVLGVITAASGLGASVFAIVLSGLIEKNGWRHSQVIAGSMILIAAVLVFFLVRSKPEDLGLKALGAGEEWEEKKRKKRKNADFDGFSMKELKKSPIFWLFLLTVFLMAGCTYAPYQILFSCLRDKGVSPEDAARLQSVMFLLLAAAKVLDGSLCDAIGIKPVAVISVLSVGLGCVLLIFVNSFAGAVLPTVLIAVGLPLTTLLPALSTNAILGRNCFDTMVGLALAAVAFSNMTVNPLMNTAFDKTGSYDLGLVCAAVGTVLAAGLYILVCRMAKRKLQKKAAE